MNINQVVCVRLELIRWNQNRDDDSERRPNEIGRLRISSVH